MRRFRHSQNCGAEPLKCAMRRVNLIAHPTTPCSSLKEVGVGITLLPTDAIEFQLTLTGHIGKLRIPENSVPRRADNLWQHTCFEAFIAMPRSEGYFEFNFAPSGEWAIYQFDSYRNGMTATNAQPPTIRTHRSASNWVVDVNVDLGACADLKNYVELRLALSAVIEENDGALSYWALAHPSGKPDFHHPDNFAFTLINGK